MKKGEFIKELEKIIDVIKAEEDDGFDYGGKVVFYKEDDDDYNINVNNIEMNLGVEASVLTNMDDTSLTCLMGELYKQKAEKALKILKDGKHEEI